MFSTTMPKGVKLTDPDAEFEKVCAVVETCTKGIARICEAGDLISEAKFFALLAESEERKERYARAKDSQADIMVQEMLEIADDSSNDSIVDEDGNERINSEFVQRSKLRVDTRKWIASKLKPKKYGDKVQQEISGPDGGPIPITSIEIVAPDES